MSGESIFMTTGKSSAAAISAASAASCAIRLGTTGMP
jgi:hypothetical protein